MKNSVGFRGGFVSFAVGYIFRLGTTLDLEIPSEPDENITTELGEVITTELGEIITKG